MPDVALISELTWRSLAMQKAAYPSMPHFVGPDEIPTMLRQSTRKEMLNVHVVSLGVIAESEKEFREFYDALRKRKARLIADEDGLKTHSLPSSPDSLLILWRAARRNGAAKIGARISADNKKASSKEAVAKIADRWPMSSDEWPTRVLLKEADISLNTAKAHLGKRPIAQYNYQAKLKRKERRDAKRDD